MQPGAKTRWTLQERLKGRRWADVMSDDDASLSFARSRSKTTEDAATGGGLMGSTFRLRLPDIEKTRTGLSTLFRLQHTIPSAAATPQPHDGTAGADSNNELSAKEASPPQPFDVNAARAAGQGAEVAQNAQKQRLHNNNEPSSSVKMADGRARRRQMEGNWRGANSAVNNKTSDAAKPEKSMSSAGTSVKVRRFPNGFSGAMSQILARDSVPAFFSEKCTNEDLWGGAPGRSASHPLKSHASAIPKSHSPSVQSMHRTDTERSVTSNAEEMPVTTHKPAVRCVQMNKTTVANKSPGAKLFAIPNAGAAVDTQLVVPATPTAVTNPPPKLPAFEEIGGLTSITVNPPMTPKQPLVGSPLPSSASLVNDANGTATPTVTLEVQPCVIKKRKGSLRNRAVNETVPVDPSPGNSSAGASLILQQITPARFSADTANHVVPLTLDNTPLPTKVASSRAPIATFPCVGDDPSQLFSTPALSGVDDNYMGSIKQEIVLKDDKDQENAQHQCQPNENTKHSAPEQAACTEKVDDDPYHTSAGGTAPETPTTILPQVHIAHSSEKAEGHVVSEGQKSSIRDLLEAVVSNMPPEMRQLASTMGVIIYAPVINPQQTSTDTKLEGASPIFAFPNHIQQEAVCEPSDKLATPCRVPAVVEEEPRCLPIVSFNGAAATPSSIALASCTFGNVSQGSPVQPMSPIAEETFCNEPLPNNSTTTPVVKSAAVCIPGPIDHQFDETLFFSNLSYETAAPQSNFEAQQQDRHSCEEDLHSQQNHNTPKSVLAAPPHFPTNSYQTTQETITPYSSCQLDGRFNGLGYYTVPFTTPLPSNDHKSLTDISSEIFSGTGEGYYNNNMFGCPPHYGSTPPVQPNGYIYVEDGKAPQHFISPFCLRWANEQHQMPKSALTSQAKQPARGKSVATLKPPQRKHVTNRNDADKWQRGNTWQQGKNVKVPTNEVSRDEGCRKETRSATGTTATTTLTMAVSTVDPSPENHKGSNTRSSIVDCGVSPRSVDTSTFSPLAYNNIRSTLAAAKESEDVSGANIAPSEPNKDVVYDSKFPPLATTEAAVDEDKQQIGKMLISKASRNQVVPTTRASTEKGKKRKREPTSKRDALTFGLVKPRDLEKEKTSDHCVPKAAVGAAGEKHANGPPPPANHLALFQTKRKGGRNSTCPFAGRFDERRDSGCEMGTVGKFQSSHGKSNGNVLGSNVAVGDTPFTLPTDGVGNSHQEHGRFNMPFFGGQYGDGMHHIGPPLPQNFSAPRYYAAPSFKQTHPMAPSLGLCSSVMCPPLYVHGGEPMYDCTSVGSAGMWQSNAGFTPVSFGLPPNPPMFNPPSRNFDGPQPWAPPLKRKNNKSDKRRAKKAEAAQRKGAAAVESKLPGAVPSSRMRQIEIAKSSIHYQRYIRRSPAAMRSAAEPVTPSADAATSHRDFMDSVMLWRRQIHAYMGSPSVNDTCVAPKGAGLATSNTLPHREAAPEFVNKTAETAEIAGARTAALASVSSPLSCEEEGEVRGDTPLTPAGRTDAEGDGHLAAPRTVCADSVQGQAPYLEDSQTVNSVAAHVDRLLPAAGFESNEEASRPMKMPHLTTENICRANTPVMGYVARPPTHVQSARTAPGKSNGRTIPNEDIILQFALEIGEGILPQPSKMTDCSK